MVVVPNFFGPPKSENCIKCKGDKKSRNPCLSYSGGGKEKILLIVDQPSLSDDRKGEIYSDSTGDWIKKELLLLGYDFHKDFWIMSSVGCCTEKEPTKTMIKHCRERIQKVIKDLKPKAIFLLGNNAIDSVIGEHIDVASSLSLSEWMIPLHDENCWAFPNLSPESVIKNQYDKNMYSYWVFVMKQNLQKCKDLPKLQRMNFLSHIEMLKDPKDIKEALNNLLDEKPTTSFDIESSHYNPYLKGNRIFSVGISTEKWSFAFPLDYPGAYKNEQDLEDIYDLFYEYLEDPKMLKIAHKTDMEISWAKVVLKAEPKGIHWCTKTTQHLLDTRIGLTGLKTQAFLRWGIKEYDAGAKPYISAKEGETFNTMHEMPLMEQLLYVGSDAYLTMQLYLNQKEELKSFDSQRFFNEATSMFTEMSINGIHVDMSFYLREKENIENDIKNIYEKLYESQEIISFQNKYGIQDFNFNSSDHVSTLFFGHLKLESIKQTKGGKESVDAEVLKKLNHWIADEILKARKLEKIKGTYINQFENAVINGMIHPGFNLFIARSLRSSSTNPNFQNIPKRDEYSKLITRSGLKPSPGNRFIEQDFSGAEVITSAAYHNDPIFINYLLDPHSDMHRDGSADIWCCDPENISDKVRFYVKNNWTFPQFYGDYYASCAKSLWEHRFEKLKDGKTCIENLKEHKINTLKQFTEHCKKAENILWSVRFKVYSEWKKASQEAYRKNDFTVKTFFNFFFKGYLDKKQVVNYPIQGTSFHLLLCVLIKMWKWLKETGMKTKLVGQIHDSGFFDAPEEEVYAVIQQFQKYTDELYDIYHWLPVPMKADAEISLVDGDFGHMFKYKEDVPMKEQEETAKKKWAKKLAEIKEESLKEAS